MHIQTRPIGSIFTYKHEVYKVIEVTKLNNNNIERCPKCAFAYSGCMAVKATSGYCTFINRSDDKNVVFVKLYNFGGGYAQDNETYK